MDSAGDDKKQTGAGSLNTPIQPVGGGFGDKEKAVGVSSHEVPFDIGKETGLPKEVVGVGVRKTPTVVPIPKPVARMGVKQTGPSSPPLSTPIVLPLKQHEVVQGLNLGVIFSWRWLSEWCIRRLKQFRLISK